MPRTNSELLQVDTMSVDKVTRFGPHIMEVLSYFWTQIDEREHKAIVRQLEVLKHQQIVTPSTSNYDVFDGVSSNGNRFASGDSQTLTGFANAGKQISYPSRNIGGSNRYQNYAQKRFAKARGKVTKTPMYSKTKPKTPARTFVFFINSLKTHANTNALQFTFILFYKISKRSLSF